jgi:RNA polymerase sigma factor FliA
MNTTQTIENVASLWIQYCDTRTEELRNLLMLNYVGVVHYHANSIWKKLPHHVELDDLIQGGIFGLRDAVASFDPARGVKFETYCVPRIRGAIFDSLQTLAWLPRKLRHKVQLIDQAREQLNVALGRQPSAQEVSDRLGIAPEEYRKLMQHAMQASVSSLSQQQTGSQPAAPSDRLAGISDPTAPNPADELQRKDLRDLLTRELSRNERLVLMLYYTEQMTMREIGEALGLSESRVSQIHSELLVRLKERWQHRFEEASGHRGVSVDL